MPKSSVLLSAYMKALIWAAQVHPHYKLLDGFSLSIIGSVQEEKNCLQLDQVGPATAQRCSPWAILAARPAR